MKLSTVNVIEIGDTVTCHSFSNDTAGHLEAFDTFCDICLRYGLTNEQIGKGCKKGSVTLLEYPTKTLHMIIPT